MKRPQRRAKCVRKMQRRVLRNYWRNRNGYPSLIQLRGRWGTPEKVAVAVWFMNLPIANLPETEW